MKWVAWILMASVSVTVATAQFVPTVSKPERPIPAIERVVIISVDGLRPDRALLADMPVLRGMLREGAYTFWAKTTAVAITLPSHTSMVTGVSPARHGISWNSDLPLSEQVYPRVPTLMEMAKNAGYTTAMVAGKSKFTSLQKPGTLTYSFVPAPNTGGNEIVVSEAVKLIEEQKPEVLFLHFPDVDGAGHGKGWGSPEQTAAIEKTDTHLGEVLAALERAGLRESTLVILSADHGGAGLTHGADDPRSRHIPWIASGPGVRKGFDLTRVAKLQVNTEDTCSTACYVLGLPQQPYFEGKPVYEAFVEAK
jgi:Uncharacterized proteins of the AP superfamily